MNTKHCRQTNSYRSHAWVWGIVWVFAAGCGSAPKDIPRKPTFPVSGLVTVDGQPVEGLQVSVFDAKRLDPDGAVTAAQTDAQGKFAFSSYDEGDGLPEGDYVATFLWGEFNLLSRTYGGPDKLKDRYSSPTDSKVKFTAKKGAPVELGKIELTTK